MPAAELERAKKAAISSVLMNLESRAVVAEDIGRQVLTYGHRCAACLSWQSFSLTACGGAGQACPARLACTHADDYGNMVVLSCGSLVKP